MKCGNKERGYPVPFGMCIEDFEQSQTSLSFSEDMLEEAINTANKHIRRKDKKIRELENENKVLRDHKARLRGSLQNLKVDSQDVRSYIEVLVTGILETPEEGTKGYHLFSISDLGKKLPKVQKDLVYSVMKLIRDSRKFNTLKNVLEPNSYFNNSIKAAVKVLSDT